MNTKKENRNFFWTTLCIISKVFESRFEFVFINLTVNPEFPHRKYENQIAIIALLQLSIQSNERRKLFI